ncbi:MAG: hypothetical protein ACYTDX_11560 [Planctomycetota bacterium]
MRSDKGADSPGPLIVPRADEARPAPEGGSGGPLGDPARALVGWIGFLLVLLSAADILVTWLPLELGNPEWEFGTVTASFNGLTSLVLGFALLLFGLRGAGRRGLLRATSVALAVGGLLVLGAVALYGLSLPLALGSVPDGPVRVGLLKAVAKTALQGVAFPVAFLVMSRVAWKWGA